MHRQGEGPPAKARRLSSLDSPPSDAQPPPPPPPPPPPLLWLPLPPPQQRPRPREETEAAQVLANMRRVGLGLGPALPPAAPSALREEGGVRSYLARGAEGEPGVESRRLPPGSLEALSPQDASGGSVQVGFQALESSSLAEEKVLETCSSGAWEPQLVASTQRGEDAVVLVDDEEEEDDCILKRKKKRRRRQKKGKGESQEENAKKREYILQALENVQLDLEAVNIKAGKAFIRLKRKFIQLRRPFLEQRDLIIQHIPGFWFKAFLNHPKISILINQRDEDIFHYLTNLQVQDLRHISMGYKMKLYFQTNPYFTNMVIVKEFQRSCSGRLVSHSTPIRWHRGQEPQNQDPQDHKPKNQRVKHSFFSWFSNHSLPEADSIAEVIKNDLWVNPVRYYMMGEEGYRANRKKQEKRKRLLHSKYQKGYDMLILEDHEDYHIMKDISSSDSDMTDFETIHDIKISDFMETTDNEITDSENLCDSKSPDYNENRIMIANDDKNPENSKIGNESFDDETTDDEGSSDFNEKPGDDNNDNKENPDDSENYSDSSYDDNHPIGNMKPKDGNLSSCGSNQWQQQLQQPATSSDSDSDSGDNEDSDDEGNDGNEGDNEGSDDDDDDDRDFEDSEDNDEDSDKDQANCKSQNDYMDEAENFLESSVEDEYQDSEEGSEQEDEVDEEEGRYEDVFEESESEDVSEDSNVEGVLLVQNTWMNCGKNSGKTG